MDDPTNPTPTQAADMLMDPLRIAPTIFVLIEAVDKRFEQVGVRLPAWLKMVAAYVLSVAAPVLGLVLKLWEAEARWTPNLLVVGFYMLVNVVGSTQIHDLLDKIAAKQAATTPVDEGELRRRIAAEVESILAARAASLASAPTVGETGPLPYVAPRALDAGASGGGG